MKKSCKTSGQIFSQKYIFHRDNLLEVWLAGASARHVEALPVDKVKLDVMNFLRRRLANQNLKITRPTDIMVGQMCNCNLLARSEQLFFFL